MKPLFTCFYTVGTLYEAEAARLRKSLDRLGLSHDLRGINPVGDWTANSRYTARHICNVLADHPDRPVVQLDADAVVWSDPVLFEKLYADGVDVALHRRRGVEWLNGTVYFGPTDAARDVAHRYLELIEVNPGCTNEQTMLGRAIEGLSGKFKLFNLPPGYCFIPDIMECDVQPNDMIVISHMQASREARQVGGDPQARRATWVAEADRRIQCDA